MWKKLPDLSTQEESELRGLRKAKLYADEDIEEEVVELFRDNGVNIKSARELGHRVSQILSMQRWLTKKKDFC